MLFRSADYQKPVKVEGVYPFDVGIASIPQVDPSNPKIIFQGPSLVLLDSGDSQENIAAWLFMKYLSTTTELQAEFSMTSGYMPVIDSVNDYAPYDEFISAADGGDNIKALSVYRALEQSDAYFTVPAFVGSSTAREQVGMIVFDCMEKCYYANPNNIDAIIDDVFAKALKNCQTKN